MTGKICVSISAATTAGVIAAAARVRGADVVEVRLDAMESPSLAELFDNITATLLFTNRPEWEGGRFSGPEKERIAPIIAAATRGAWVDIELSAPERSRRQVIAAAAGSGGRVIVSWHDFASTPDRGVLEEILARQMDSGADIGKMVTMARDATDSLRLLSMLEIAAAADFSLCAFSMGEAGRMSRVASIGLGGFMTYAAPDHGAATAQGQLPLAVMRRIIGELS